MDAIPIIAVDIDGILNAGSIVGSEEVPRLDIIKKVNQLYNKGIIILLYTSRDVSLKSQTIKWLDKFGVCYNDVVFNKLRYNYILDDKAITEKDFYTLYE